LQLKILTSISFQSIFLIVGKCIIVLGSWSGVTPGVDVVAVGCPLFAHIGILGSLSGRGTGGKFIGIGFLLLILLILILW
jgi:hypothetical protein